MGRQKALIFPPYFATSFYTELWKAFLCKQFCYSYKLLFGPYHFLLFSTYIKDMFSLWEVDNVT